MGTRSQLKIRLIDRICAICCMLNLFSSRFTMTHTHMQRQGNQIRFTTYTYFRCSNAVVSLLAWISTSNYLQCTILGCVVYLKIINKIAFRCRYLNFVNVHSVLRYLIQTMVLYMHMVIHVVTNVNQTNLRSIPAFFFAAAAWLHGWIDTQSVSKWIRTIYGHNLQSWWSLKNKNKENR